MVISLLIIDFYLFLLDKFKKLLRYYTVDRLTDCTYDAAESILASCYIIFTLSITILVCKLTKTRTLLAFTLLMLAFCTQATVTIKLTNDSSNLDMSSVIAVYPQQGRALSFDEFKLGRTNLSPESYDIPNYGFNPNGVWLYGEVTNLSGRRNWIININFSQLEQVDFYLVSNEEVLEQISIGREQGSQFYRTPTFRVMLDTERTYQVYLFVKSKRNPIIAPVRLMSEQQLQHETLLDYLIWGVFYGALLVTALYCIGVLIDKKELSAIVLFTIVCLLFLWQMVWSGHVQLLPKQWYALSFFKNAEILLPIVCAAASLFTLTFLPKPSSFSASYVGLKLLFLILTLTFIIVLFGLFSEFAQALLILIVGFLVLLANIIFTIRNISHAFSPAKVVLVGWLFITFGSLGSSLFIAGKLPVNYFTTYVFQAALLAQILCFVLAIILKVRFSLELEIHQASNDAENNFLLIEEQNVHLHIARREAVKASDVKSQFLANMSHEIRTPLNAIIGFSRELESSSNETERDEHIRIINSAASDLLTIVNDILDFSKMEAGKLTINQKPFSPVDIFEDIASLSAKPAHLKQLEFMFDIDTLPSMLIGDSFKLKQLVCNLLSNALKFTNYGHIMLRVKSLPFGDDNYMLCIEVEDTGIGISNADKNKLFKPFNQLDDDLNRSFQGTGLGLVICQELTFLMRGSIEVESLYSQGSKFKINLPFKALDLQVIPAAQNRFVAKKAGIYDPIPESRKITCRLLKSLGFDTYTFDSIAAFEQTDTLFDYIFASLPMRYIAHRTSMINRLLKIKSQKTALIFSGPQPEDHQIRRVVNQPIVIRSPLTLKNINELNKKHIESSIKSVKSGLKSLPPARVLAVDDMALNLKLLDTWLKNSPITLDTASCGADAISLCKQNEYDLILMDIQMPTMDGLQATKHIRQTELNLGTPIIAITAHALPEEKERFMSSGMDDFLPKPVDLDTLVSTIKSWCRGTELTETENTAINWQIAITKAHGNEAGARDFLEGFIAILPQSLVDIELHWQKQDFESLQQCIHKLHGASAYTGATSFQKVCYETESNLKRQQYDALKVLISTLLVEAEAILEQWRDIKTAMDGTESRESPNQEVLQYSNRPFDR
ncbi:MAG: two-component system sensor histidine kinase BarA [Glaciecola sp.]|jgi:two-component system sensor histidine kinase BarA